MFYQKKVAVVVVVVLMFGWATAVSAQTPRPTPTNVGGGVDSGDGEARGSMQGNVYLDVNGDGVCVNSGVEGERPIEGVPVEFVSSDEQTVITVTSGDDGGFGLFAAGQSNWRVTAKPESGLVVTSANPLHVPVYPESLGHTGVNFCVAEGREANGVIVLASGQTIVVGDGVAATGTILLPEAGAPARPDYRAIAVWGTAVLGMILFGMGATLEYGRRRKTSHPASVPTNRDNSSI